MLKSFETEPGAAPAPARQDQAAANAAAAAGEEAGSGAAASGAEESGEEKYLRAALGGALHSGTEGIAPQTAAAVSAGEGFAVQQEESAAGTAAGGVPAAGAEAETATADTEAETETETAETEIQAAPVENADPAQLQQEVQVLQEQVEQLKQSNRRDLERMIRALAEAENQRKRAEADVERERKFGNESLLKALLPVADSLELALQHCDRSSPEQQAMAEGVENTSVLLLKILKDFGVEQLNPAGEMFNPKLHQAISMAESAGAKTGQVLQVMQKGFMLNGRVVRPAMVVVARTPASPEAAEGGRINLEA